jgi:hypothetical protein
MSTPWIVIYDGDASKHPDRKPYEMECLRCGERYPMTIPVSVTMFVATSKAFASEHRHCRPRPTVRA